MKVKGLKPVGVTMQLKQKISEYPVGFVSIDVIKKGNDPEIAIFVETGIGIAQFVEVIREHELTTQSSY